MIGRQFGDIAARPRALSAKRIAILLTALLVLPGLGLPASADLEAQDAASFALPTDPDRPVLSYTLHIDGVRDPDPGPSLSVFGDGRVQVHYPHYMRRAGDYEARLGEGELRALVRSMLENGVLELDPAESQRRKRQLARAQRRARAAVGDAERRVESRSSASLTELELRLARYTPAGEAESRGDVVKQLRWRGLREDARRYASLREIRGLDAIRGDLEALMRAPGLRRVDARARARGRAAAR